LDQKGEEKPKHHPPSVGINFPLSIFADIAFGYFIMNEFVVLFDPLWAK
jgi:hypothetical protein